MRWVRENCVVGRRETVMEILKSFEQVAGRFSPAVLLAPGLTLVVLGLVAWLAGMYLRRLMLALAAALAGGIAGWLASGPNPAVAGPAAAGGAAFGAILPRLAAAVLLAALGVAVAFVITAQTPLAQGSKTLFGKPDFGRAEEKLTAQQSLEAARSYAFDCADNVKSAARRLGPVDLAVLAAVGLVLLVLGLIFTRLAGALVCSVFGTVLIFAGMTALLILKGSTPIARMQTQGAFYGLVLLGMAAFGTLEQFLLCSAPPRHARAEDREAYSWRVESDHRWRNR